LYSLILSLKTQDGQTLSGSDDWIENALVFEIISSEIDGILPYFGYCQPGEIYMKSEWSSINP
jgi:hypothetical protein